MSKKHLAFLAIFVASLLWSTSGVSAKILVADVNPIVISMYRFFIASLCILPFFIRQKHKHFPWKQLLMPTIIGGLSAPLFFLGIKTTLANSGTLIYTATPLVTAILAYFLIREKNSLSKWIGILIGLIGVILIILLPTYETKTAMTGNLQGNMLITAGMLCWTVYAILCRKLRLNNQVSSITTTSIYFFVSTILCFLFLTVTNEPLFPAALFSSPTHLGVLIYLAIGLTLITFSLYQWAIGYLSATTASFKQYIEVVFAIIVNGIFLGEKMTTGFLIGASLVVLGLIVATVGKMNSLRRNK
ncbi:MAG: DMT family transporter [Microgenomates group bacterium]